jgi:hypothetical protein
MADKNHLLDVPYKNNEPVLVSADIENNKVLDLIGARENLSNIVEIFEVRFINDLIPAVQR